MYDNQLNALTRRENQLYNAYERAETQEDKTRIQNELTEIFKEKQSILGLKDQYYKGMVQNDLQRNGQGNQVHQGQNGQGTEGNDVFGNAMSVVFGNEGGYVNDPDDRGGATNMGITTATFNQAKQMGLTNANSVAEVSKEEATNIYRELYWNPSKAGEMPDEIAVPFFDSVVHHGVAGGAKLLQRAINTFAGRQVVAEDGVVGPATLSAINSIRNDRTALTNFVNIMLDIRDQRFDDIVSRDPTQKKFIKGWKNRTKRLRPQEHVDWLPQDTAPQTPVKNETPQMIPPTSDDVPISGDVTAQPQANANATVPNTSPVVWKSKDGNVLTQQEYDELLQKAETGQLFEASNQEELDEFLDYQGYTRVN